MMTLWNGHHDDDLVSPDQAESWLWATVDRMDLPSLCAMLKVADDGEARAVAGALPLLSAWRRRHRSASVVANWGYRVTWKPVPTGGESMRGRWLVLLPAGCPDEMVGGCVAALSARGVEVVPVEVPVDGSGAALDVCLRDVFAGCAPARILSLLGLDERVHRDHAELTVGITSTMSLVHALVKVRADTPLWFVTGGPNSRHQACVLGVAGSVAADHPEFWGGTVELSGPVDERTWDLLVTGVGNTDLEDQLAVRPAGLVARRLVRVKQLDGPRRPWDTDGTVLVTGGTGRVGTHVARWLAGRGVRRILLASRRGPEAPGVPELRHELGQLGAAVSVVACDVTDRDEVAALLAAVPTEHPLTAVVHAAGVQRHGAIDNMTSRGLAEALGPTAAGAWHLHELTLTMGLRGFVVFSSTAGTWATRARASDAAASACLDALAELRREQGLPGVSVAWGPWSADHATRSATLRVLRRTGLRPMSPDSATTALGEIIDDAQGTVLLADVDWERLPGVAGRRNALFDDIPEMVRADGPPTATLRDVLGRLSDMERRRTLLDMVRTHAAAVLGHGDADAVSAHRPFRELGVDSAGAVEFRNRLTAATGLPLPTAVAFDYPTPAVLADFVATQLWPSEPTSSSPRTARSTATRLESADDDELFGFIKDEFGIV